MKIIQIAENVFISEADEALDRPIIGIIKGTESTLLFDACSSKKHAIELKNELLKLNIGLPKNIIISHSHTDHWFGLAEFDVNAICSFEGKQVIDAMCTYDWSKIGYKKQIEDRKGSPYLEKILDSEYGEDRRNISLRKPNIWTSGKMVFDLGTTNVIVDAIETSHCPGSLVLFIPSSKVLFLGDLLYIRKNEESAILRLLKDIDNFQAEYFIDSHVNKVLNRATVEKYLREQILE